MGDIIPSEILIGSHYGEIARVPDTPMCVVVEVHHDSRWIEFYPTSLVISIARKKLKKSCYFWIFFCYKFQLVLLFPVFLYEEPAIMKKKIKEPNKYFLKLDFSCKNKYQTSSLHESFFFFLFFFKTRRSLLHVVRYPKLYSCVLIPSLF